MFGRIKPETGPVAKDIGLLGTDTRFEGSIRFTGTLRIDGNVVGNIASEPGSGSVLIVNQEAVVQGDIVSDSVLISGRVEGTVHASERVEIFRAGLLRGDVYTADIMIEGGAEFHGYCHMSNGTSSASQALPGPEEATSIDPPDRPEPERGRKRAEREEPANA